MTLRLAEIRDLAYRFVPGAAADSRLYEEGARSYHSWWPAHEIGHFLVATAAECRQVLFGLDVYTRGTCTKAQYHYVIAREVAAMSISQKLLRRTGHIKLADEELFYTDEDTHECSTERWCRRTVRGLLRRNNVVRLPTSLAGMEVLLTRKAQEVGTRFYATRREAEGLAA